MRCIGSSKDILAAGRKRSRPKGVDNARRFIRSSSSARLARTAAGEAQCAGVADRASGARGPRPRPRRSPADRDAPPARTAQLGVRGRGPAGFRAAPALKGIFAMSLVSIQSRPTYRWHAALRVTHVIRTAWQRFLRRRRRLHELGELAAMDDLSLRDIAISRCEIRAAIQSRGDMRSVRR